MTCYRNIPAWRQDELNKNGKYEYRFKPKKGESSVDPEVFIPCGTCSGCRMDQAKDWKVRLYHESLCHKQNCFVTLTYADPPPEEISKEELKLFWKRLRRRLEPLKIRYFACGEYGEKTRRPHYHAILFGTDFLANSYVINDELYGNKLLEHIWQSGSKKTIRGNVVIAEVTPASIAYVAGYCNKKIGDEDTFNMMSTKPIIGYEYFIKNLKNIQNMGYFFIGKRCD